MHDDFVSQKRIRDKAPYRKSLSMTGDDVSRAAELERLFNTRYSIEAPFNFSKTISKALELAMVQMLQPENVLGKQAGPIQQSLTGSPADPSAVQVRLQKQQEEAGIKRENLGPQNKEVVRRPSKFQKKKRGF